MGALGDFEIVLGLEAHPDSGACSEVAGEAHGGVSGDSAFSPNDFADPQGRNADVGGNSVLAEFEWLHEVFKEHFAWMNGVE